jgi:hypothetical protein
MKRFLTGYAVFYNRRHRRHGHLFQNRFKSIVVEEFGFSLAEAGRQLGVSSSAVAKVLSRSVSKNF